MENTNTQNNLSAAQQQEGLQLLDLLGMCISHWKWFVLSGVVCVAIAIFYLMGQQPVYTRQASILIKEQGKGGGLFSSELNNFAEMGLFSGNTNVNNELVALQSPDLLLDVVRRLDLDMNYSTDGKRRYKYTLYGSSLPVKVESHDLSYTAGKGFDIKIEADSVFTLSEFKIGGKKLKKVEPVQVRAGVESETPIGNITVNYTPFFKKAAHEGMIVHVSRAGLLGAVRGCRGKMKAALNGKQSTIIDITYNDVNVQRAEDFLNTLISAYNESWVRDKNQIAISTSEFINERLKVIERELSDVDRDISSYKSNNLIPNVQTASNLAMTQANQANLQITELNNQLYMARYIKEQVRAQGDKYQLLPANSGVSGLDGLIGNYNSKVLQRNSLVANSSEENPLVVDLDRELKEMKDVMVKSIDNEISSLNTRIQILRSIEDTSTSRLSSNPKQEEYLLSVQRQQTVKEALYLFLLQKREENELSQAFTAYNTRTISSPNGGNSPIAPKKMQIILIALVIALMIPVAILYLTEVLNTKVRGRKDIEKLSLPFIGEIPQKNPRPKTFWEKIMPYKWFLKKNTEEQAGIMVKPRSRNVMNEAFRVVRTNMEFMEGADAGAKIIMFTSVNPGSGKTFLSINIAASFAIKGKKVIVLDLDLRRASMSAYVNKPKLGIADYLNGSLDDWASIKVPVEGYGTLEVIPVGTMPPNPAELLYSPRMQPLLDELSQKYDMIFLDCPPVEIVADASVIAQYANLTVFVIRAGVMEREMLPVVEQYYKEIRFSNMCMLLNGTTSASSRYGYHRYGYHYGYAYGYGRYGYGYGHYGSYGYTKED